MAKSSFVFLISGRQQLFAEPLGENLFGQCKSNALRFPLQHNIASCNLWGFQTGGVIAPFSNFAAHSTRRCEHKVATSSIISNSSDCPPNNFLKVLGLGYARREICAGLTVGTEETPVCLASKLEGETNWQKLAFPAATSVQQSHLCWVSKRSGICHSYIRSNPLKDVASKLMVLRTLKASLTLPLFSPKDNGTEEGVSTFSLTKLTHFMRTFWGVHDFDEMKTDQCLCIVFFLLQSTPFLFCCSLQTIVSTFNAFLLLLHLLLFVLVPFTFTAITKSISDTLAKIFYRFFQTLQTTTEKQQNHKVFANGLAFGLGVTIPNCCSFQLVEIHVNPTTMVRVVV